MVWGKHIYSQSEQLVFYFQRATRWKDDKNQKIRISIKKQQWRYKFKEAVTWIGKGGRTDSLPALFAPQRHRALTFFCIFTIFCSLSILSKIHYDFQKWSKATFHFFWVVFHTQNSHLKSVQANVLSPFLKIVTICWWTLEQNPLRGNTNMIIMSLEVEGGGFLEGKQWRDDCAFTSVQVRSTSNDVFFSWTAHFQNWCQCSSDKVLLGSLLMIYLYSFMPSNGSTKYYDVNFSTKKTFHELLNRSCKDFSYAGNLKWVILNLYKYIWSFLFGVVCLYFDGLYIYLPDSCRVMSDWVVDLK